ncbi:hypothetical protein diail_455 [Diaporthe ilicicola]|nr:hypothetical protein diail_455 [Diaporthe ilicicola]
MDYFMESLERLTLAQYRAALEERRMLEDMRDPNRRRLLEQLDPTTRVAAEALVELSWFGFRLPHRMARREPEEGSRAALDLPQNPATQQPWSVQAVASSESTQDEPEFSQQGEASNPATQQSWSVQAVASSESTQDEPEFSQQGEASNPATQQSWSVQAVASSDSTQDEPEFSLQGEASLQEVQHVADEEPEASGEEPEASGEEDGAEGTPASQAASSVDATLPTKVRPWVCDMCPRRFWRKDHKVRHQKTVHGTFNGKKMWPCPYCPRHVSRPDNLRQHCRKSHQKKDIDIPEPVIVPDSAGAPESPPAPAPPAAAASNTANQPQPAVEEVENTVVVATSKKRPHNQDNEASDETTPSQSRPAKRRTPLPSKRPARPTAGAGGRVELEFIFELPFILKPGFEPEHPFISRPGSILESRFTLKPGSSFELGSSFAARAQEQIQGHQQGTIGKPGGVKCTTVVILA